MSSPSIERSGCSLRTLPSEPDAPSSIPALKTSETSSLQQAYWNGELWKESDKQHSSHAPSLLFTGSSLPTKSYSDVTKFLQRHAQESATVGALSSLNARKPMEASGSINLMVIAQSTRQSLEASLAQGLSVRAVVDRTHWASEVQMNHFMDAYIAVSSEQPKYAQLHTDAVKDKPRILAERQSVKEREVLDQIEVELNRPAHEATIRWMQVRAPLPVQPYTLTTK